MMELGQRENVWCKLSGMVTEAKWDAWTPETLKPYLDVAVEAFGPERLMAGSDWPVCLVASGLCAVVGRAAGLLCVIQRGGAGRRLRRHSGTGLRVVVFAAAYSKQEYAGGVDLADAVVGRMEGPCTDRPWVVASAIRLVFCFRRASACWGWSTTRRPSWHAQQRRQSGQNWRICVQRRVDGMGVRERGASGVGCDPECAEGRVPGVAGELPGGGPEVCIRDLAAAQERRHIAGCCVCRQLGSGCAARLRSRAWWR